MSFAYLDPGSGSLIASVLVGGAAAAGVAVKSARAKLSVGLRRKGRSDDPAESGTGDGAAEASAETTDAADASVDTDVAGDGVEGADGTDGADGEAAEVAAPAPAKSDS
jgi:hypothetical protein